MAIVVIRTKEQIKNGMPDPPTNNADGSLARAGAAKEARKLWGEMGSISSDEELPRLVWRIGSFDLTVGKGRSWEEALRKSAVKKERLKLKEENYREELEAKDQKPGQEGTRSRESNVPQRGPGSRDRGRRGVHRGGRPSGRPPVSGTPR